MKLYMAPMEGLTGYIYRQAFGRYFGGADKVFTPKIDQKPIPVLAGWKFRLDKKDNFEKRPLKKKNNNKQK